MLGHFLFDPKAHSVAPGKQNNMGPGVGDQGCPGGFARPVEDLKHAGRHSGLFKIARDPGPAHRRILTGLQDDAVAQNEGQPGQPKRERHGKIPGRDGHDHTARLQDLIASFARHLIPQDPSVLTQMPKREGVLGSMDRLHHVGAGLVHLLAGFAGDNLRQGLRVFFHQSSHPKKVLGPLDQPQCTPALLGPVGRVDRLFDLGGSGLGKDPDEFRGMSRIPTFEPVTRLRRFPGPIDKVLHLSRRHPRPPGQHPVLSSFFLLLKTIDCWSGASQTHGSLSSCHVLPSLQRCAEP